MDSMRPILSRLMAVMLLMSLLTAPATAGGNLVLDGTDASATAGGTVQVTFEITNRGTRTSNGSAIDIGALPAGWRVMGTQSEGGTVRESALQWVWLQVGASESVSSSVTLAVPDNASTGNYTIQASASDTDGIESKGTATVEVVESAFSDPLIGAGTSQPPTDPDNDGKYEDINGDGRVAFVDVIAMVFADFDAIRANPAQRQALDFTEDGRIDFTDVIELVFQV